MYCSNKPREVRPFRHQSSRKPPSTQTDNVGWCHFPSRPPVSNGRLSRDIRSRYSCSGRRVALGHSVGNRHPRVDLFSPPDNLYSQHGHFRGIEAVMKTSDLEGSPGHVPDFPRRRSRFPFSLSPRSCSSLSNSSRVHILTYPSLAHLLPSSSIKMRGWGNWRDLLLPTPLLQSGSSPGMGQRSRFREKIPLQPWDWSCTRCPVGLL